MREDSRERTTITGVPVAREYSMLDAVGTEDYKS